MREKMSLAPLGEWTRGLSLLLWCEFLLRSGVELEAVADEDETMSKARVVVRLSQKLCAMMGTRAWTVAIVRPGSLAVAVEGPWRTAKFSEAREGEGGEDEGVVEANAGESNSWTTRNKNKRRMEE